MEYRLKAVTSKVVKLKAQFLLLICQKGGIKALQFNENSGFICIIHFTNQRTMISNENICQQLDESTKEKNPPQSRNSVYQKCNFQFQYRALLER